MAKLYDGDNKNIVDLNATNPLSSEELKAKVGEALRQLDKDDHLQEILNDEDQIDAWIEQNNSSRLEYLSYQAGPGPKREAWIGKTIAEIKDMKIVSTSDAVQLADYTRDQIYEISEPARKKLKEQVGMLAADADLCTLINEWLDDYSEEIRFITAKALVDFAETGECVINPERIIRELLRMEDQDIRQLAAFRAGELLNDSSLEILRPYLDDENKQVRENIFASLTRIDSENCKSLQAEYETLQLQRHQKEIADWIVQLNDPKEAWWAAIKLGDYGAEAKLAIDPLLWLIENSEKSSDRSISIGTLGQIGIMKPGVDSILRHAALSDSDESVRKAAVESLGRMHEDFAERIEVIVDALHSDPSVDVRQAAAEELRRHDIRREQAVPALARALEEDPDEWTRVLAAWGLRDLMSPLSAKALINALKTGTDEVRLAAADGLSDAGSFPNEAIPALIDALSDDGYFYFRDMEYNDHVYDAAMRSLYRICEPAIGHLEHARDNHKDSIVRERASEILHNIQIDQDS